ncbi:unnamed protein product [Macrosiphum euphorbiae]|uniref:Uncharacterized protein n=1 Tax=Macrosiphum euphorbiae TaxID=13131 RepID=A0AAV0VIC7_9HEMI|nr:unnamed protein product [Macrosiphum euphorbiae]
MMNCGENKSLNLQPTETEVMQSVFAELRAASFHVPERTLLQFSQYITGPSSISCRYRSLETVTGPVAISRRHQSEPNVTGPSTISHLQSTRLQTSPYFAEDQNMQTTPPRRNSDRSRAVAAVVY